MKSTLHEICRAFIIGVVTISGVQAWAGQHHSKQKEPIPYFILHNFSSSGEPVLMAQLPLGKPDSIRKPAEDNITPKDAKISQPGTQIGGDTYGAVRVVQSNIEARAYLPAHRHSVSRIVFNNSVHAVTLERNNIDGSKDSLKLKPGQLALFAPDPSNKFHNDFNPTDKAAKVVVIELDPSKIKE